MFAVCHVERSAYILWRDHILYCSVYGDLIILHFSLSLLLYSVVSHVWQESVVCGGSAFAYAGRMKVTIVYPRNSKPATKNLIGSDRLFWRSDVIYSCIWSLEKQLGLYSSMLTKYRLRRLRKMVGGGRINYAMLAIAILWSMFIFYMYSTSSAACLAEMERLRMAVDRKDRFLELVRDQNDYLKEKISKLQEELKKSTQEKMWLVREIRVNNRTV